jgi:diaminopimelate epimerase
MTALPFAKYHGLGNDFLLVDLRAGDPAGVQSAQTARALCDRRFGVGGDGVLPILPPTTAAADARMRVLNADGSEAEMCGNGVRCVAKELADRDPELRGRDVIRVETLAGIMVCAVGRGPDGRVAEVTVDMGRPALLRPTLDEVVPGFELAVTSVSMGNPHAVAFVAEAGAALRARAERQGPALEAHAWYPARTNVELAHVDAGGAIELVVWERGCGITLACGTGACATAVAACLTGRAERGRPIPVRLLGGELTITVEDSGVKMRGPATHVYDGAVRLARRA